MKNLILMILMLCFSCTAGAARMYQWIEPDTKTTQLSGKPPHWYRSGEAGPRVLVFENGRVIDDTGIVLSEEENDRLRQQALIIVAQDRLDALEKLAKSQQQKAAFGTDPKNDEVIENIEAPLREDAQEGDTVTPAETDAIKMAEQMRQLLEQYEAVRTQNARELVETARP